MKTIYGIPTHLLFRQCSRQLTLVLLWYSAEAGEAVLSWGGGGGEEGYSVPVYISRTNEFRDIRSIFMTQLQGASAKSGKKRDPTFECLPTLKYFTI